MTGNTKIARRAVLMGSAAAAALALSTRPGTAQAWDEVVAAARKEGKLTLYHNISPAGIEPLLQKFRAAFAGIQTEHVRLGSAPLNERFATEFSANRNLADVLITYADERYHQGVAGGWFAKWTPPELGNFPPETTTDNMSFAIQTVRECIIWNKNLVKPADAPQEWADLFDAKWKGKVGINPPWRSISVQQLLAYWDELNLGDTAAKLKANNVRFFEGSNGIIQAVIRGDVHVAHMTDIPLNPTLADGAPLGFVYPKSGTTIAYGLMAVAAKAPRPNVARVFANWLMSADGQKHLQEYGGLAVTRKGSAPLSHLPATASLPKVVDGAKVLTPEKQKKMVEHWRTTFGVK